MRVLFNFLLILCGFILFNCKPVINYISVNGSADYETEKTFIKSILDIDDLKTQNLQLLPSGNETIPSILIEFFTRWESEIYTDDIIISKKYLIPYDDFLSERANTTLEACLNGSEKLIQIDELKPPYIALKVDNLAVGEKDYPLVKVTGIKININNQIKKKNQPIDKIDIITKTVNDAEKPFIQKAPEIIWITAGGDTMLERGATEILLDEGPAGIFGKTAEMFASSDIALLNLEGVITTRSQRTPKTYNFKFIPEVAPALKEAGIYAVLHANNHVFDYGEEAFRESLEWLTKSGIGVLGAGVDIEAASDPVIFKKGEQEVRMFGLASFPREGNGWDGVNAAAGTDRAGMLHAQRNGAEKIKQKMKDGTLNVIFFHGGTEWSTEPDAATRELYTNLITSGADLIIGTHPHIVQGFEWVQGKPVFWSLGNFVFGGMKGWFTGEEGLFIRMGYWNGNPLYIEPYPVFLNNVRTDIVPHEKLKSFYERSRKFRSENN